jgi:hypothetical protein
MIGEDVYGVDPWTVPEHKLQLDLLSQTESIFALSNGHIGLRADGMRFHPLREWRNAAAEPVISPRPRAARGSGASDPGSAGRGAARR